MTRLRLPSAIVSDFGEPPLDLVPKAEVDELIRWVRKEVGTKGQAGEQEGIEDTWAEEDEERWIAILWRDEPPWNDLKDPLELMPEEEVNAVVRQMLEDEARRGM